jgi:hypothetical protein
MYGVGDQAKGQEYHYRVNKILSEVSATVFEDLGNKGFLLIAC